MHLPGLISDLVLILCSAAVISLIFKKLKQPIVLGYILVGFLVGPNFKLFPTIIEAEGIRTWAEIGVIFLLFGLGLEFSFKKLIGVGGIAAITALLGITTTMFSGYLLGSFLGWGNTDSLFLGGILAIASTTIIFKAFEELGVKSQKFTGNVMGILVVEDLVAVVLMVILSTLAIGKEFEGVEMIFSIAKLGFFLILWFILGIFFLPSLFKRVNKLMSDELLLILSLALCFIMVFFATSVGFSAALGSFIMGSILAETVLAEKIEALIQPLKSLFGAIFFVSVGMLINPEMLITHIVPVIIATLVLLIIKPFFITVGSLISGQPLHVSVQTGMSLSQIGEFSFIIATLGLTLKVTSDFLYPIAVAVSVVTTFTTPYMIKSSNFIGIQIEKIMPEKWVKLLNIYSLGAQDIAEERSWRILLKSYTMNIAIFSVVIFAIILLSTKFLIPFIGDDYISRLIAVGITLAFLSPFLWALSFHKTHPEIYEDLWSKANERGPLVVLFIFRISLTIFFIGFLFHSMYSPLASLVGLVISISLIILFRKKVKVFYGEIEVRFFKNLESRQEGNKKMQSLTPWDSHMARFELGTSSSIIGMTLIESSIRERFGVNIAVIKRGDVILNVPHRHERLYPGDTISVIGTDAQLERFKAFLNSTSDKPISAEQNEVALHHFTLNRSSELVDKSILDSGIRELSKGLVVGIERNDQRILNPESNFVFKAGDKIWLVGNEKRIQILAKQ